MTLTAAYMRLSDRLFASPAIGGYFNLFPQPQKSSFHFTLQFHLGAGVCPQDRRHRASFTKVRGPVMGRGCLTDQATFFILSATKVVSIEE